jgi:hypothetical protein
MDKQLLQSFNNLSVALQALADTLERNSAREGDSASAIADALKDLDVTEQLRMLNEGIEQINKKNEDLAKGQKNILDGMAKITERQKEQGKKIESTNQAIKAKKERETPGYVPNRAEQKGVSDGVKMILLIAAGILAIGLAFKVLGSVDIKTVVAISLALPLIAFAYKKIAEIKTDLRQMGATLIGLVLFSAAVALSSAFLSYSSTITIEQGLTIILISAAFAVSASSIGKMAESMKGVSIRGLLMMPLVMIVTSFAIAVSSRILERVQPVGLPQMLTAIGIAVVFGVVGYTIGKVAQAASKTSIAGVVLMPFILIATSYAIAKSSEFLSQTKEIGMRQFLTAVGIALVFVVLSFALPMLSRAMQRLSMAEAAMMPFVLVAMSTAITLSSYVLSEARMMSTGRMFNIVLQAITLTVVGIALGLAVFLLDKMGLASEAGVKKAAFAGASILILASTLALSSQILAMGNYTNSPGLLWSIETGLGIMVFGLLAFGMDKLGISPGMAIKGGISIVLIAATIMITSQILSIGDYTKYPSWEWTWQSGAAILAYGLLAVAASFGIMLIPVGAVSILIIAATIVATDYLLGLGSYDKFPPMEWTKATLISIGGFGAAMVGLALFLPLLIPGAFALAGIAFAVLAVDKILAQGDYTKAPSLNYANAVSKLMSTYGTIMVLTGPLLPLLWLGKKSMKMISEAIKESADILSSGNYTGGPTEAWAKGVGISIGAFAPVFKMIVSRGIIGAIFGGGASPEQISSAIRLTSRAIMEAAFYFNNASVAFKGGPTKEWAEGVGGAINAFAPVLAAIKDRGFLGKIFGGNTSPEQMSNAIKVISEAIVDAAEYFAAVNVAFKGGPTKEWAEGVGGAIGAFAPVFDNLQSSGLMGIVSGVSAEDMASAINTVSMGIIDAARLFGKNPVGYSAYPTKEWAQGVGTAITSFGPVFEWASENMGWFSPDEEDLKKVITSVAQGIVQFSRIISGGIFTTKIDPKYMESFQKNISDYMKIMDMLSMKGYGDDTLSGISRTVSTDIAKIASDYDRLTQSVTRLSQAISNIDVEKMTALKTLTGTVVLMSLMDPAQFGDMMDKFEEKAGVLAETINDLETSAAGGQQLSGQTVRQPGPAGPPPESPSMKQIVSSLGRIEQRLASISDSAMSISSYVNQLRASAGSTKSLKTGR